jgi:RNA polymerase sigma factor (sigma-70 family)
MRDVDAALLPFLHSTDESERDHTLGEFILEHASPIVRQALRRRLGFYVDRLGINPDNPEAEDLYHEAVKEILKRLRELQSNPDGKEIKHFGQYVQRVTVNVCHNYLRSKAPRRYRLKSNLRYLLDSHKGFKIWKSDDSVILCGLADWPQRRAAAASQLDDEQLERLAECCDVSGKSLQYADTDKVVGEIFRFVGGPVELDTLVEIVATLQGTKDQLVESLDYLEPNVILSISDSSLRVDERMEEHERIEEIWEELRRLPRKQRLAICLRFEGENTDDLWSLLFDAGICTPLELAEEFDLSLNELMTRWARIPMSNADIAEYFDVRKQQVSQWRSRGWDKLRHLIGGKVKK